MTNKFEDNDLKPQLKNVQGIEYLMGYEMTYTCPHWIGRQNISHHNNIHPHLTLADTRYTTSSVTMNN